MLLLFCSPRKHLGVRRVQLHRRSRSCIHRAEWLPVSHLLSLLGVYLLQQAAMGNHQFTHECDSLPSSIYSRVVQSVALGPFKALGPILYSPWPLPKIGTFCRWHHNTNDWFRWKLFKFLFDRLNKTNYSSFSNAAFLNFLLNVIAQTTNAKADVEVTQKLRITFLRVSQTLFVLLRQIFALKLSPQKYLKTFL